MKSSALYTPICSSRLERRGGRRGERGGGRGEGGGEGEYFMSGRPMFEQWENIILYTIY